MKKHYFELGSKFSLNLSFISFVVLFLSYLSLITIETIVSNNLVFALAFAFLFCYFIFQDKLDKKNQFTESVYQISQYIFLGLLLILAINHFWKNSFISLRIFQLTVLSIFFGVLTFYKNRERVEQEIGSQKKTNFLGNSKIVKWFYNDGYLYSFELLIIFFLGFFLRVWNLDNQSFWIDEIWHVYASYKGLIVNSLLKSLDVYSPAIFSTVITYIFMDFFGFSHYSLRFPFVLFGSFLTILAYFVGKNFYNKSVGLYFAYLVAISPIFILYSREIRFYILLAISILVIILNYHKFLFSDNKKYLLILLTTILLTIIFVHYYLLIIIPFLIIDYLIRKNYFKFNKIFLLYLIIFFSSFLLLYYSYGWILDKESYYHFSFYIFNFLIYEPWVILLFFVGLYNFKDKNYIVAVIFIICIFFLSILPIKEARYSFFLFPLLYLFASKSYVYIYDNIHHKKIKLFWLFMGIFIPLIILYNSNLYYPINLGEQVSLIIEPNDFELIKSYFNLHPSELTRDWISKKPDYNSALLFIEDFSINKNEVIIIPDSIQTASFYNDLYGFNFKLVHPYNTYKSFSKSDFYILVGHRFMMNDTSKISQDNLLLVSSENCSFIRDFDLLKLYECSI